MTAQACQHHPEQAAVGVCVRCGAPFCDACLTKLDGINHCRPCLDRLARSAARVDLARATPSEGDLHHAERGARTKQGLAWLTLGLSVVLLSALALSSLNAVLPAGAP